MAAMTLVANQWSPLVSSLIEGSRNLERLCTPLQIAPLQDREWYELLCRKLQPQLGQQPFLIVAVVGGTNIGKSVIFNHLAGEKISSTSPLASGTKHPTALIPKCLDSRIELSQLFSGFSVEPWQSAEQPLAADSQHRLFYRVLDGTPENLVILDTPDVDSVEEVNWERADYLRQSADVLIAVLTQQKYNDAAVKEFFRKASKEGKLVIVIFNQCLLPEDEDYWPLWLKTFCDETEVQPHLLYLAPYDRRAAESNQLTFYERHWPQTPGEEDRSAPRNLLEDLSKLKFDDIKTRALAGAMRHLTDPGLGVPAWLKEIRRRSGDFQEALQLMSANRLVEVQQWPTLPNAVLIQQIREWWRDQREGWSASVHGFYSRLGQVVTYPLKFIRQPHDPAADPLERYRQQEWEAVLQVIDHCLQRLTWLRDLGNPLLTPRLDALLQGAARTELISRLRAAHDQVDFELEVSRLVDAQLRQFREERPDFYKLFRRLDAVAAAVRPGVSLMLFMTGAGPLGEVIAPAVADTAFQGALHVAGETVGGTVVTVLGDKAITDVAGTGAGYLEAKFRQLHTAFVRQRADWMIHQLEVHLLGDLPKELGQTAGIPQSEEFQRVSQLIHQLSDQLSRLGDLS